MDDLISRQAAIKVLEHKKDKNAKGDIGGFYNKIIQNDIDALVQLPSATLNGYDIKHLELIASVLQKENLTPERVTEAFSDISRVIALFSEEFEDSLTRAVEQCLI